MASKAAASERLQARLRARAQARKKTQSTSQSASGVSSKASARKARRQRDRKALEKCCGGGGGVSSLPASFDTYLDSPFGIPAQEMIDPPYVLRHPQFMNVSTGRDLTGNCLSAASRSLAQLIIQDPHRFISSVLGSTSRALDSERCKMRQPQQQQQQQQQGRDLLGLRINHHKCSATGNLASALPPVRVLTVGSGLGLPGLMLQRTLNAHVVLTDRDRVVLDMLRLNAQLHQPSPAPPDVATTTEPSHTDTSQCSRADVVRLTWGSEDDVAAALRAFSGPAPAGDGDHEVFPDLVMSTECFSEYSDLDIKALAHTLLLCCGKNTTVGIAFEHPSPVELNKSNGPDHGPPLVDVVGSAEQLHELRQVVQNKFQMLVYLLHCGGLQGIEFGDDDDVDAPSARSSGGCVPFRLPNVDSVDTHRDAASTTAEPVNKVVKSALTASSPTCFLALFRRKATTDDDDDTGPPPPGKNLPTPNYLNAEGPSTTTTMTSSLLLPSAASTSVATPGSEPGAHAAQPRSPLFVELPPNVDAEKVARELQLRGFCVIDNFLSPEIALAVEQESELVKRDYLTAAAVAANTQGGGLIHIRSDISLDVDPLVDPRKQSKSIGTRDGTCDLPFLSLAARILQFPLAHSIGTACGEKLFARERPQLAIYPGQGSFYVEHFDNPRLYDETHDNGRRLTAVFYLNRGWDPAQGGALRVDGLRRRGGEKSAAATQSSGVVEVVLPELNRLVLFWSDEIPHEVLPAYASRSALTVWLNRGTNLTRVSSQAPNRSHVDDDPRALAEIVYDEMAKLIS